MSNEKCRCSWCGTDPLYCTYHDNEWGTPLYDEQKLFEFLMLEGAQAGLSWQMQGDTVRHMGGLGQIR